MDRQAQRNLSWCKAVYPAAIYKISHEFMIIALIVGCSLLMGCKQHAASKLPLISDRVGDDLIITLIAPPGAISNVMRHKYPNHPRWVLRVPKTYVSYANRLIYDDDPEWMDQVIIDFLWPSMEPWEKHRLIAHDRVYMTTEKNSFHFRADPKARQFIASRPNPRTNNKLCSSSTEHNLGAYRRWVANSDTCEAPSNSTIYIRESESRHRYPEFFTTPSQNSFWDGSFELDGWNIKLYFHERELGLVDRATDQLTNFLRAHTVSRDSLRENP